MSQYPEEDLSEMRMLKGIPPLEYSFSIQKMVRVLKRFLRVWVGLKLNQPQSERANGYEQKYIDMFSSPNRNNFWSNLFGSGRNNDANDNENGNEDPTKLVPMPERIIEQWQDDKEMARQFLAGTNPVMIRVVDSLSVLSNVMINFLEGEVNGGINTERLVAEKRLIYATYEGLAKLKRRPHETFPPPYNEDEEGTENENTMKHFHPATIVFELDATNREELSILAIQLELEEDFDKYPEHPPLYSKSTSTEAEWLMAKTCVMVADSQYHEVSCLHGVGGVYGHMFSLVGAAVRLCIYVCVSVSVCSVSFVGCFSPCQSIHTILHSIVGEPLGTDTSHV